MTAERIYEIWRSRLRKLTAIYFDSNENHERRSKALILSKIMFFRINNLVASYANRKYPLCEFEPEGVIR